MSSRVDPHFELVLDLLNRQGRSYRAVACTLADLGVRITPQSLHSWHIRRLSKIARRRAQGNSTTATDIGGRPQEQVSADRLSDVAIVNPPFLAADAGHEVAVQRAQARQLLAELDHQEKRLADRIGGHEVGFLVPRRS